MTSLKNKRSRGLVGRLLLFVFVFTMQAASYAATLDANKVKGKVTSASDGEALIGVTVSVKETNTKAITDFNGEFTIEAQRGQTLSLTYMGFLTKDVKVTANELSIALEEDNKTLGEVVVIGYGTQKKKLVTGATTQLKGESVAKLNTNNALQAMPLPTR